MEHTPLLGVLDLVQPGAILADKREEAFMTDDEGEDPTVHPADALALSEGAQEAAARTRQESSAALLLHDAAQDFRAVIPTLTGEALQLAVHLYDALDYWQQSQFGGAIAVHNGTQTESQNEQANELHRPLRDQAERQGKRKKLRASPHSGGRPTQAPPASGEDWRGQLQAKPKQCWGVWTSTTWGRPRSRLEQWPRPPRKPLQCHGCQHLQWPRRGEPADTVPEEGGDRESPTTDSEGSHLVSLGSHRRRRAHAVCDLRGNQGLRLLSKCRRWFVRFVGGKFPKPLAAADT